MAHHENAETARRTFEALAGCSLEVAETNLRRGLRTSGTIAEGERYGTEWRVLEQWCEATKLILPESVVPAQVGGREHDLLYLPDEVAWLKFTKPWCAGYAVDLSARTPELLPARPTQYLRRLALQNRYFGDAMRFIGITADPRSRRIVTSQRDITGRSPLWGEISDWFARHGFRKLTVRRLGAYDAMAFATEGIGVFDVRPANLVIDDAGELIPIDLMLRTLTAKQFATLSGQ